MLASVAILIKIYKSFIFSYINFKIFLKINLSPLADFIQIRNGCMNNNLLLTNYMSNLCRYKEREMQFFENDCSIYLSSVARLDRRWSYIIITIVIGLILADPKNTLHYKKRMS